MKRILLSALLAVAVWWGWQTFFPGDERLVRRLLDRVAANASAPASGRALSEVLAADRLQGCFTPDVDLDVDVPGEGRHTLAGREELMRVWLAARSQFHGLRVEFLDVNVTVAPDHQTAAADLTARVRQAGERDVGIEELRIGLVKRDDVWRVHRVESTRTLRP